MTKTDFAKAIEHWVLAGLLEFWRQSLPEDKRIIPLITLELGEENNWADQYEIFSEVLEAQYHQLPLTKVARHYQLKPAELFILALCGTMENHHLVNLTISELQAPDKRARPAIHTLVAISEALFSIPIDSIELAHHPLVEDAWIQLSDDAPIPLQSVSMLAPVWRFLLKDGDTIWPGCRLIDIAEEQSLGSANLQEAHTVAALIGEKQEQLQALILRGSPSSGRGTFTATIAQQLGQRAIEVPLELWQKTPVLRSLCQHANWLPVVRPTLAPGELLHLPSKHKVVVILGNDGSVSAEPVMEIRMQLPNENERLGLWKNALQSQDSHKPQEANLAPQLATSVLVSAAQIHNLAQSAQRLALKQNESLSWRHIHLARRHVGAEKLRTLAQLVEREVDEHAMVLTEGVKDGLDHFLLRAQKREQIWRDLGRTLAVTQNPGVRGMFVGESGTGKTLAASYIATQLGAPLYRVDLSSIMNKYIGESEKNLAQLLDHAAANDIVLLFDEADALFGARSDGKNTGERFANMLTNFLLTRIETHPGVVILTTNSEERIDPAFNRRIDIIVSFPEPSFEERLALWHSHLGQRGPGDKVYRSLASHSDFSGGQIRNVVLAAATHSQEKKISIDSLMVGLRLEYGKLGREVPNKIGQLVGRT